MVTMQDILTGDEAWFIAIRIVGTLLLTWAIAKIYKLVSRRAGKSNHIHLKFINSIIWILIYAVGFVIAMQQLPHFNAGLQTLLAGSGIVALTIGLAAQESLGNAINGMFISVFRPFEVGDRVRLINGGITGYVEDITLRHTVIRTFINSRVIVPNSTINKDMIENSNYLDGKASGFVDVTITHDSDLALAQETMRKVIAGHPDFVDTRPPEKRQGPPGKVYVRGISVYGVELRMSMWTDSIGNNFDACSDAREGIKREFDRLGIRFAQCAVAVGNSE